MNNELIIRTYHEMEFLADIEAGQESRQGKTDDVTEGMKYCITSFLCT